MTLVSGAEAWRACAAALVGADAAQAAVAAWRDREAARVGDPAFAARFAAHFSTYAAPPDAYAHRWFDVSGVSVLGGVRFYGGDTRRPFVDALYWDGEIDVDALRAAVRDAWRVFAPESVRLLTTPDRALSDVVIDQTAHAATVGAMTRPDPAVALAPIADAEEAAASLAPWYAAIAAADPALRAEIHPASADDLAHCAAVGTLDAILVDGVVAGVFATAPGDVAFLSGDEIVEECVAPTWRGRGVAARAQAAFAARRAAEAPDALLIGEIQRLNAASRRSAERAGRATLLSRVFAPL